MNIFQFLLTIVVGALLTTQSHAATITPTVSRAPTTTATPGPTTSEQEVKESLRDRLKRAIDEKSDEAQEVLGQRERRAIVGTLKDLTDSTLTLTTKTKEARFSAITDNTVFIRKGKPVATSDVALGDYLIVMGYPGERDVLDAKRVVISDKPTSRDAERVLRGTVATVNSKLKTFTLTVPRPAELGGPETLSVSLLKKSTLNIADIVDGNIVVVVGTQTDKNKPNLTLLKFQIINPSP